jgi:hypothetical protein
MTMNIKMFYLLLSYKLNDNLADVICLFLLIFFSFIGYLSLLTKDKFVTVITSIYLLRMIRDIFP